LSSHYIPPDTFVFRKSILRIDYSVIATLK
jgi:hypothetical protein